MSYRLVSALILITWLSLWFCFFFKSKHLNNFHLIFYFDLRKLNKINRKRTANRKQIMCLDVNIRRLLMMFLNLLFFFFLNTYIIWLRQTLHVLFFIFTFFLCSNPEIFFLFLCDLFDQLIFRCFLFNFFCD